MLRTLLLVTTGIILMVGCDIDKVEPGGSPPPAPQPNRDRTAAELKVAGDPVSSGHVAFRLGEGDGAEIYTIAADGTLQRVTRDVDANYEPDISPDGSAIYYTCRYNTICRSKPDGSQETVVTVGLDNDLSYMHDLAISPDGTTMLFIGDSLNDVDIYKLDLQTRAVSLAVNTPFKDEDPTWTPDGGIVWTRVADRGGHEDGPGTRAGAIVFQAAGTTDIVTLAEATEFDFFSNPDVSPDGTTIAFVQAGNSNTDDGDILTMNADGSGQTSIVSRVGDAAGHPSWSPDGKRIVFSMFDGDTSQRDLYTVNPDGSVRQQLTDSEGVAEEEPVWGDLRISVSVNDVSAPEGDTGSAPMSFEIKLSAPSTQQITVLYRTVLGSATPGIDYDAKDTNSLVFAPGETSKTVQVSVLGDTIPETNESFYLELSNPSGAILGKARGKGLIENDDLAPTPTPTPSASPSASPTTGPITNGRIAFSSARNGGALQLFTVNSDGSDVKHVSSDQASSELSAPSWSSGVLRLIYTALNGAQPEIVDRPADGTGAYRLLVLDPSVDTDPVYVPGDPAGGFVWSSDRDGDFEIYYSTPSGTPKKLTNNTATDEAPTVSNDGLNVVYQSDSDGDFDLYRLGLSASYDPVGTPANLTQEATGAPKTTEVSPDYALTKNMIAFSGNEHGDFDIFTLDLTSMVETHLTTDAANEYHPTMSPDGNQVAFVRDVAGNLEIFRQQAVVGQTATNITNNPTTDQAPDWGPL